MYFGYSESECLLLINLIRPRELVDSEHCAVCGSALQRPGGSARNASAGYLIAPPAQQNRVPKPELLTGRLSVSDQYLQMLPCIGRDYL